MEVRGIGRRGAREMQAEKIKDDRESLTELTGGGHRPSKHTENVLFNEVIKRKKRR
jgi:hypothetical protein